jgi:hypothetical protein
MIHYIIELKLCDTFGLTDKAFQQETSIEIILDVQNYCLTRAGITCWDGVASYICTASDEEKHKTLVMVACCSWNLKDEMSYTDWYQAVTIAAVWRNRYYLYTQMHAPVLLNCCHVLFMYITKGALPFSQVMYCFLYISVPFLVKSVTCSHFVCSQLCEYLVLCKITVRPGTGCAHSSLLCLSIEECIS